ncbi:MAG: acyl-CoA thioesterase [Nitrososphaerales archaeon]
MARESKSVEESSTVICRLMMPSDANPNGNVYGGSILKSMDEVAGIVASRHARRNVVTASINRMDFFNPVHVGDLLVLKASVNFVGQTSMEVGVRIESEDLRTGKVAHIGSSYFTFVALDGEGKPTVVPDIILRTEDEKRRYRDGAARREARLRLLKRSS